MSRRELEALVDPMIARFQIKAPSPAAAMATLSGGKIQRAVLARELTEPCSALIAVNHCFGLDFAVASEIRAQIMMRATKAPQCSSSAKISMSCCSYPIT